MELTCAEEKARGEERFESIFQQLREIKENHDRHYVKIVMALIAVIAAVVGKEAIISSIHNTPADVIAAFWICCIGWGLLAMFLFYKAMTDIYRSWRLLVSAFFIGVVALMRADMGYYYEDISAYSWWLRVLILLGFSFLFLEGIKRWMTTKRFPTWPLLFFVLWVVVIIVVPPPDDRWIMLSIAGDLIGGMGLLLFSSDRKGFNYTFVAGVCLVMVAISGFLMMHCCFTAFRMLCVCLLFIAPVILIAGDLIGKKNGNGGSL